MSKKESSFLSMVLTLFIVCLVAGAALGLIYEQTKNPIAKAKEEYLYKQINVVIPGADGAKIKEFEVMSADNAHKLTFYKVTKDGKLLGTAVKSITEKGFSGKFTVIVSFDKDGRIMDSNVLSHAETPGLGDKMDKSKSSWNEQFRGKNPEKFRLKVTKDGGKVDAITASTISSRAYCDALQRAYNTYKKYMEEGGSSQ